MSTLSLTNTLQAGTPEDVNDVQTNFDDIVTWANGNISETNIASSSGLFSTYRTIRDAQGGRQMNGGLSAGTYFFTGEDIESGAWGPEGGAALYLDDADYAITGKSTKLRIRAQCYVNAEAPGATFTVGLYPITAVAGVASTGLTVTVGAVVGGSTVAFASPGASSTNQSNSGDFAFPADGHYVLAVAAGAVAAGAGTKHISFAAQLQVRHV